MGGNETNPARALGFAFTHAPHLDRHQTAAASAIAGVSAEHTGFPVKITVKPLPNARGGGLDEQAGMPSATPPTILPNNRKKK
ncbi:hypothetical protein IPL85_04810 [Candidatus Saccharibacteria bacterium]|nr:MAG: hypothetical protein IPL85_04810 [Candidatus Saccharibacteria bacterium]